MCPLLNCLESLTSPVLRHSPDKGQIWTQFELLFALTSMSKNTYFSNAMFASVLILGTLLWAVPVEAISLAGSNTTRIVPQRDVRRFLGIGPTTGQYVDSDRDFGLEGDAIELTFWHNRGSWDFTQSLGLSYYEMDGSDFDVASGETSTIDYSRLTLNFTLGYAIDFGLVDVHPQYMLGYGEGTFSLNVEGNGSSQKFGEITNAILVRGPQVLFHFDLSDTYFVGLKLAEYGNVGTVRYLDDEGVVEQNRVAMLIFGYRVKRSYSVYSRDRAWHGGIIDWFGY